MKMNEEEAFYVTLALEDGIDVECEVIAKFPIGEKNYIALMPEDPVPGFEEGALFLYGCEDLPDDGVRLIEIESEEEYEEVCEAFEMFMDED